MVLIVNGATSALMYRMSDALGSFVPVLAKSSRCGRAPALSARRQREDCSSCEYAPYDCCPIATPSLLTSSAGILLATATSQRLRKIDATEATSGFRLAS